MRRGLLLAVLALTGALLGGCSGINPKDYADSKPIFRIERYFDGHVRAWGMFQGRSGEVKRRFTVDVHGHTEGDEFILREHFKYADGSTQKRVWHIRRLDDHHYEGRAGDIVGVAKGTRYGNALHWHYTLALPVDGDTWHLKFNDWMYLQEDGVMINRTSVSKYGFHVGDVTIAFRKQDGSE
ncbi:MAG TPA: DUF3833 domain-containing protein [Gammaproteobacteria bacterium]|nr:DUF3833 domain-containing protein [Gammaproteobacteria bacterium]